MWTCVDSIVLSDTGIWFEEMQSSCRKHCMLRGHYAVDFVLSWLTKIYVLPHDITIMHSWLKSGYDDTSQMIDKWKVLSQPIWQLGTVSRSCVPDWIPELGIPQLDHHVQSDPVPPVHHLPILLTIQKDFCHLLVQALTCTAPHFSSWSIAKSPPRPDLVQRFPYCMFGLGRLASSDGENDVIPTYSSPAWNPKCRGHKTPEILLRVVVSNVKKAISQIVMTISLFIRVVLFGIYFNLSMVISSSKCIKSFHVYFKLGMFRDLREKYDINQGFCWIWIFFPKLSMLFLKNLGACSWVFGVRTVTWIVLIGFQRYLLWMSFGSRSWMGLNISIIPH